MAVTNAHAHAQSERLWLRVQELLGAVEHAEQYATLLADSELPALLVECLELQRVHPDSERLQQINAVLLQMIEMPEQVADTASLPPQALELVAHGRDWAIDTILDVPLATHADSQHGTAAAATVPLSQTLDMQQLQTSLCTFAAHSGSRHVVDELQEAIFSAFALEQAHVSDAAFARVLELCATTMSDDLELVLFLDAMLATQRDCVLPSALVDRLLRPTAAVAVEAAGAMAHARVFDQLSASSMVRVWGNSVASWEAQLQDWLVQAHAAPLAPIAAVVWRSCDGAAPADAQRLFQRYAHLYPLLLHWCAQHSEFLASPRSTELVAYLSVLTRSESDSRAFGRMIVPALGRGDRDAPVSPTRLRMFERVKPALATAAAALGPQELLYEWLGLAEHPPLVHEALELLFTRPSGSVARGPNHNDSSSNKSDDGDARDGARALVAWFAAFTTCDASASAVAAVVREMAAALGQADLVAGSTWLQQTRAAFADLPRVRIQLAWVWLLQSCFACADSIQSDAAVASALESIEYAFRRFAPATSKRAFQVEVVVELLRALEWRWSIVTSARTSDALSQRTRQELQERVDVPVAWLKKVVQLMQLEHQSQKVPSVVRKSSHSTSTATLSEQLSLRLTQLFHTTTTSSS